MDTSLIIHDQTASSLGTPECTFTVTVAGETITLRELIAARVTQEVTQFNQTRPAYFRMLVQPSDAERTLNGLRMPRARQINPEIQVQKALEAFERNGFIVLVGDRQAESLDETITLQPALEITFLKLLPLVGG